MFAIDVQVARESFVTERPVGQLGPARSTGLNEAPALVDALRDQMGLSTSTERQPIRLFVVEHVEPLIEN
jgi:uncharacterized protein (TIGR03435 family)